MIQKIKVLAITVGSMLALISLPAAAAQATPGTLTVEGGGAINYSGTQIGAGHTMTLPGGRTLFCSTAVFAGAATDGASETVMTPTYEGCMAIVAGSSLPVTVTENDCTFRITFETTTNTPYHFWKTTTHMECPGPGMQFHIYLNHDQHTAGVNICTYETKPQTVLNGRLRNAANGDLQFDTVESEIALTKTFGAIGNCGGTNTVSKYNGETILEGAGGVGLSIH